MIARPARVTFELIHEKGVMLAPVKVLHLPDPGELAVERLGPERAAGLLATGAATARSEIITAILAASVATAGP